MGRPVMEQETLLGRLLTQLPLIAGILLLGDALLGNGTLGQAGWLHRGILTAIGAGLVAFSLYRYWRLRQKRSSP